MFQDHYKSTPRLSLNIQQRRNNRYRRHGRWFGVADAGLTIAGHELSWQQRNTITKPDDQRSYKPKKQPEILDQHRVTVSVSESFSMLQHRHSNPEFVGLDSFQTEVARPLSMANKSNSSITTVRSRFAQKTRSGSDSARILLDLLSLAQIAAHEMASDCEGSSLGGVISETVLHRLLATLHQRDLFTIKHSRRVATLAVGLAKHLGWDGRELRILEIAALLHDVGKIGVPDNVLLKPGNLNADEVELMALHYAVGVAMLQACHVHHEVLQIIGQSQRANTANRDALKNQGRELHLGARILAVADAYESLSTDQVYRYAKSHQDTISILSDRSGIQFDSNIVCSLNGWIQKDGSPFVDHSADDLKMGLQESIVSHLEFEEYNRTCQIFSYLHTLESLYDGFYLLDADYRVLVWNGGAEGLLGRSAEEMLGAVWSPELVGYRTLSGDGIQRENSTLSTAIESGRTAIAQLQTGDGCPIELQAIPLLDNEGSFRGAAEFLRDMARSRDKQPQEFRALKLAATRDPMTQLVNRSELENQFTVLINNYLENPLQPFCVIFTDVDHFKRVNDTYGHQVGDRVLIELAKLLTRETYSGEVVGRYGGEEFVVLCPSTNLEQGIKRAERLRTALDGTSLGGIDCLKVTASFGIAQSEPGDSVDSILGRADRALYSAKGHGRNQTCSLTNADLRQEALMETRKDQPTNPLLHTSSFTVTDLPEIFYCKLGGFVRDHNALLTEVTTARVTMRIGHSTWWKYFGWPTTEPPLEIGLTMGGLSDRRTGAGPHQLLIAVKIRPQHVLRNSKPFQDHAIEMTQELKRYFAVC